MQAHRGHSFRFWRDARRERDLREPALAALDRVGLAERADVRVERLSHGEHRQLEIAMALATQPRLLLLDEPMAGMGPDESAQMVRMLQKLKGNMTIMLVEHDMEAVFALADRLTVLVYGRIIASGDPAAVREDAGVRQAYLGEKDGGQGGASWLSRCSTSPALKRATGSAACCSAFRFPSPPAKWFR